jgi:dTDP-4-amino-4,6-dideoxygalactose transaminase
MNSEAEARTFEKLRLQGVTRFPDGTMDVDLLGGKANLTDVAAAIGLGQLKRLDGFTGRRRELARLYFKHFDASLGCELPAAEFERGNWHMCQPLLPLERLAGGRPRFIESMKQAGIGVGVHYPAMHLFTLFRQRGCEPGDFPVSEHIGARTVTLPLFPAMEDGDVTRVCDAVSQALTADALR